MSWQPLVLHIHCFDPFWLPQFHTFPHHWRISLANHSPMIFTNVLENLFTVGMKTRQWDSTVFRGRKLGNQIQSNNLSFFAGDYQIAAGSKTRLTPIITYSRYNVTEWFITCTILMSVHDLLSIIPPCS